MKQKVIYKSMIGIDLEHGQMRILHAVRNGKGILIRKTVSAALSIDPLTCSPELLGQEIRNQLTAAGIRDTHCVISLSLKWVLRHRIEIPDLSEEDRVSFLQLQAEKKFPFALDDLSLASTGCKTQEGTSLVTLAAVPLTYIQIITAACKTAKLKPVSVTVGYPNLNESLSGRTVIYLEKREEGIDFLCLYNGKCPYFRFLESEPSHEFSALNEEALIREIRISIHELSGELQKSLEGIYLNGPPGWVETFLPTLRRCFPSLPVEPISSEAVSGHSQHPASFDAKIVSLYGCVSRYLERHASEIEFLPPKIGRFEKLVSRISSRRNLLLGGTAAAAILLVCSLFVYQSIQLSRYEAQWNAIRDRVAEVESIQNRVKQFRPWFDTSCPSLSALLTLTRSFPEEGSVWAKTIEIENIHMVSCTGMARDNREWLAMLDRLNQDSQVEKLQVQQMQGQSPIQYRFNFLWLEG